MASLAGWSVEILATWLIRARVRAVQAVDMNGSTPATELLTAAEDLETIEAARRAAYRRFTAVVLGLDVATLASQLRATRLRDDELPLAA